MSESSFKKQVLNELLVQTFNDILKIEQKALSETVLDDLSITKHILLKL